MQPAGASLGDYVALTKPRIVLLMVVTGWAGLALAPTSPPPGLVLATLVGLGLAAASGGVLNCYLDRDIDKVMSRTAHRPLPAGRVQPRQALVFGIALGVLAFGLLAALVNLLTALLALGGVLFYVLVYTLWLKRTTPQNIVIGGAAGAVPPLVGWAASTGRLELPALLLFGLIFLWTPPHFWALALLQRDDYRRAGIPMLPVVRGEAETKRQILLYSLLLVAVSLALYPARVAGPFYLAAAVLLGAQLIRLAAATRRDEGDGTARRLYKYSVLYLGLLFVALVAGAPSA